MTDGGPAVRTVSMEAYKNYEDEVDAYAVGGAAATQTAGLFERAQVPTSKLPNGRHLLPGDPGPKGLYAEHEEVFNDIEAAISSLIDMLVGSDPERGRMGELVGEIEADMQALSRVPKDNPLSASTAEIIRQSNDLEAQAYRALPGWSADGVPPVEDSESSDSDSTEEPKVDKPVPLDPDWLPVLVTAATHVSFALAQARAALIGERRRQLSKQRTKAKTS